MSILYISVSIFMLYYCEILLVSGQEVPATPCPEVFQYYTQANGDVYGRITVPHDGSTTLGLSVNASIKGYYTDNNKVSLKIKMITPGQDLIEQRAQTLTYSVAFPFQHTIPKITNIELNNRRYCTGPPEELIPGAPGVTSMWAGHKFYFQTESRTGGPPRSKPEDPDEELGQPVTSNKRYPTLGFSSYPTPDQHLPVDNSVEPSYPSRSQFQECGVSKISIVPLIIGGTEISEGQFPWLSAIFTTRGAGYGYKCTGNLVTEKHVLTAARCLFYFKGQIVENDEIILIFGKSNLRNWAISGAVIRGVSRVIAHPQYNQDSGHADIAILTLDRPLQFSNTIAPICLWSGNYNLDEFVNTIGTVAGWGAEKRDPRPGQYSVLVAKSLDMPIVSKDRCLDLNLTYYSLTSDLTFCAGERDGRGTCIGDLGAGFMVVRKGKYYLRGMASIPLINSKGECDPNFYMIFCDVAKLTDWIRRTMI